MPKKLATKTPIADAFSKYRQMVVPRQAGDVQVRETRQAFFAGATVLYTLLMGGLEDGQEPTENDLKTIETIADELQQFGSQFDVRHLKTQGRG